MLWKVQISTKPGIFDALADGVKKDIEDLGIKGVRELRITQIYFIEGTLSEPQIVQICENLLCDSVTQEYSYRKKIEERRERGRTDRRTDLHTIEVAYNPGVMDPVEAVSYTHLTLPTN